MALTIKMTYSAVVFFKSGWSPRWHNNYTIQSTLDKRGAAGWSLCILRASKREATLTSTCRKYLYLFTSPEAQGGEKQADQKPKTHLSVLQTGRTSLDFTTVSVYSTQSVQSTRTIARCTLLREGKTQFWTIIKKRANETNWNHSFNFKKVEAVIQAVIQASKNWSKVQS